VSRSSIKLPLLLFAMLFPTIMAWLYLDVASPAPGSKNAANPLMVGLYAGSKVIQFLLPLIAWRIASPERLRWSRPQWSGLWPALSFGVASFIGIVGVYFLVLRGHGLVADMPAEIRKKILGMGIGSPLRYICFAIFVSTAHAAFEEYYWRAYVFRGLRERLPSTASILLSALSFTGHHVIVIAAYQPNRFWTGVLPLCAGVFLGGAIWAWLCDRYGTIYPAWVSHALIDIAIMIVGYDMAFHGVN